MTNLWVDKYRPKNISEMVLNDELRKKLNAFIETNNMPHITLFGRAGIGKTTLANILAKKLGSDILYVNCSKDGSVDDIRTKVFDFANAMSIDDKPKIIILDEADGLSKTAGSGSSAQDALRGLIEDTQRDTRFILTCNYINKIIGPIQSRCTPIELKFNKNDVFKKCLEILANENIIVNKETAKAFMTNIIMKCFPDMRNIINVLELWVVDKEFIIQDISTSNEMELFLEILMPKLKKKDFETARQYWLNSESIFTDYENLAGALFEYESDIKSRLIIGKHLHEMAVVLDKEINFLCMIYELYQ